MNIFLAGCELGHHALKAGLAGHKYVLMSYYNWGCGSRRREIEQACHYADKFGFEVILDSGLFSFMFGAGKEIEHTYESMREYAQKYVAFAEALPIKKLTVIECDAQKMIGVQKTYRIRADVFEKSRLNVMYVWHVDDGLANLEIMAQRYKYISLGCPELRKVFKGEDHSYHRAISDLVGRVACLTEDIPKIHLLGNTVFSDIQFHDVWSCDSTSWLSGEKFGATKMMTPHGLKTVHVRSELFIKARSLFFDQRPDAVSEIEAFTQRPKFRDALMNSTFAAYHVKLLQENLDRRFAWQGDEQKLKDRI